MFFFISFKGFCCSTVLSALPIHAKLLKSKLIFFTHLEGTEFHSKIKKIALDDLEEMTFAQPDLYNKLVELRRKMRNTYAAGSKTSQKLHQVPFCEPMLEAAS